MLLPGDSDHPQGAGHRPANGVSNRIPIVRADHGCIHTQPNPDSALRDPHVHTRTPVFHALHAHPDLHPRTHGHQHAHSDQHTYPHTDRDIHTDTDFDSHTDGN